MLQIDRAARRVRVLADVQRLHDRPAVGMDSALCSFITICCTLNRLLFIFRLPNGAGNILYVSHSCWTGDGVKASAAFVPEIAIERFVPHVHVELERCLWARLATGCRPMAIHCWKTQPGRKRGSPTSPNPS